MACNVTYWEVRHIHTGDYSVVQTSQTICISSSANNNAFICMNVSIQYSRAPKNVTEERPGWNFQIFLINLPGWKFEKKQIWKDMVVLCILSTKLVHCTAFLTARWEECKSAGIKRVKNDTRLWCWTQRSSAPGCTVRARWPESSAEQVLTCWHWKSGCMNMACGGKKWLLNSKLCSNLQQEVLKFDLTALALTSATQPLLTADGIWNTWREQRKMFIVISSEWKNNYNPWNIYCSFTVLVPVCCCHR